MKKSKTAIYILFLIPLLMCVSCKEKEYDKNDLFNYAKIRTGHLQLSIYITAQAIDNLLSTDAGRRESISIFRCNGITKAVLETYRAALVVDKTLLEEVKHFFLKNGIEVVGGIATVPGKNFGVHQEGKLGWFNWQNPATQNDLKEVVEMSASIFDEFIIDDFLCTADTSVESKIAKGDRTWSQYRRDLLTDLSKKIFIEPARKVNPIITMVIKYPQWYDRFHLFGYDLEREPELFDKVWVGTETRGQYTQRYGFVQPYEGFVNYRWIKDIAGAKIGGAWFDHGDCDENDFIEQAYQTVLAGAKEIILFNYYDFVNGHKGHHLLRTHFHQLADLAQAVAENKVQGVTAYKPLHSDAGGDLYLMDFIGSLGVPLVPVSQYPKNAEVIFLPTQAAADKDIFKKVMESLAQNATLIFTTGFLANNENGERFAQLAGTEFPVIIKPIKAESIINNQKSKVIKYGLDLESDVKLTDGRSLLEAETDQGRVPFLIKSNKSFGNIYTINTHTFSQEDFDKVGEVLLCPKPLGLLELPESWVNTIRAAFNSTLDFEFRAPARVTIQPLGKSDWMIHNYNTSAVDINITGNILNNNELLDGFNGEKITAESDSLKLNMQARSRIWVKIKPVE